jgi:zona occludens toxin (predicted ATPase)
MKKIYFLLALVLLTFGEVIAQDNSAILNKAMAAATADSSFIAVNKKAGWRFLASYITPMATDSAMIEMVVRHDKSIDWTQEQPVGRIKRTHFLPATGQTLMFSVMDCRYQLRIEPNGRCYLRLYAGTLPDDDPLIVPVRAVYKLD